MKNSLLIILAFSIVAVFVGFLSLDFWMEQRNRPIPVVIEIDDSFSWQNVDVEKSGWSQESYDKKLGEVLAKYEVSREEWLTNTGDAWTNKWVIIKEMNAWQMENN
jgi:hypothetical protein